MSIGATPPPVSTLGISHLPCYQVCKTLSSLVWKCLLFITTTKFTWSDFNNSIRQLSLPSSGILHLSILGHLSMMPGLAPPTFLNNMDDINYLEMMERRQICMRMLYHCVSSKIFQILSLFLQSPLTHTYCKRVTKLKFLDWWQQKYRCNAWLSSF